MADDNSDIRAADAALRHADVAPSSAPRIAGHRYPTPTGEPCPRTIRVDGTIEHGGNCQSCGTCLLYGGLVDLSDVWPAE